MCLQSDRPTEQNDCSQPQRRTGIFCKYWLLSMPLWSGASTPHNHYHRECRNHRRILLPKRCKIHKQHLIGIPVRIEQGNVYVPRLRHAPESHSESQVHPRVISARNGFGLPTRFPPRKFRSPRRSMKRIRPICGP